MSTGSEVYFVSCITPIPSNFLSASSSLFWSWVLMPVMKKPFPSSSWLWTFLLGPGELFLLLGNSCDSCYKLYWALLSCPSGCWLRVLFYWLSFPKTCIWSTSILKFWLYALGGYWSIIYLGSIFDLYSVLRNEFKIYLNKVWKINIIQTKR